MTKLPGRFSLFLLLLYMHTGITYSENHSENHSENYSENWDLGITVYAATITGDEITEVLTLSADYGNQYHFIAVALAKKLASYNNKRLDVEVEAQWVRHNGVQQYSEYNALLIARWHNFPWDVSSFAIGEGLSYASEIPQVEALSHNGKAEKLLNYLMFELAVNLPDNSQWQFVTRLHHRSGIYGTFDGVYGASNAVGMGVRYKF